MTAIGFIGILAGIIGIFAAFVSRRRGKHEPFYAEPKGLDKAAGEREGDRYNFHITR